jgi:hypothetical protein
MNWGSFGVINNHVDSHGVVVMSTKKPADEVWEEIFDSLVVEAEPPQKYVKRVTITTRDGSTFSVSPQDFSALIEQERGLPTGYGDILSARMSLDFNRIKRDIDRWANDFIASFDANGKPHMPSFPKPVAGEVPTKRRRQKTNAVDNVVEEPVKKTRRQKPTS